MSGGQLEHGIDCHVVHLHGIWLHLGYALKNSSVDDLAELYRAVPTDLLDLHCPIVKARHRAKQKTPWFNADCRAA